MEKTWDEFYKTGKITDYLKYRNSVHKQECPTGQENDKIEEYILDGTGSCSDRYGFDSHAD